MSISSTWSALLSLVVPVECVRCRRPGQVICECCRSHLFDSASNQPHCFIVAPSGFRIGSHLPFSEEASRIVLGAKDDGNKELERIVVKSLLKARSLFPPDLILVPIPTNTRARLRRGRDFLLEMASQVARESGDLLLPLLSTVRRVAPQKSLNAVARSQNMNGAFTLRRDLSHTERKLISARELLIVDDVLTTGATMREAFRALSAGQARCLGGISAVYSLNWRRSHLAH